MRASEAGARPAAPTAFDLSPLRARLRSLAPPLLFGVRLWASVSLSLYLAYWLALDDPFWAGTSAAIVCQPQLGASLRKGWFRLVGTVIGALVSVVLAASFPQDRLLFLLALAVWGAACAFAATILHNFSSYAAALAGYTVAIAAGDLLGATGGIDANAAFLLAVARANEICLGIVCAGIVLAGTEFGGAQHRLAARFADLASAVIAGFVRSLTMPASGLAEARSSRRELIRRVGAVDPIIDQAIGESAQIRYHSRVLQRAIDGLFAALSGWRAVALHRAELPIDEAQREAAAILEAVPENLRSVQSASPAPFDPIALLRLCDVAVRRLDALPAGTPSLRLLADLASEAFAGIGDALDGLALLWADPARPTPLRDGKRLRVPDWLPAFVNAGRAFVVIGAATLFWVVTAWPGGSLVITFAAIVVLLLGPLGDLAYGAAILFTAGGVLDLVLAAIVEFAVLPGFGIETFAGLSLVIGCCLVPMGTMLALARLPWQLGLFAGMTMQFMPLLAPANPMHYDLSAYYNAGLAIIAGCAVGALSFRLLPPLNPAFRARRLLALTLRDLRQIAGGRSRRDWQGRVIGRLTAMPEAATPLQRAQLLTALAAGETLIQLRSAARRLDHSAASEPALAAVARGDSAAAIRELARLDAMLASQRGGSPETQTRLRARATILALSEALSQHAAYFDAGASK